MSERICLGCGKPLSRKEGEAPSTFARRKNCGRECASAATGKQRGKKTRYPSRHATKDGSTRWVSASQYLAEMMVERRARKEGKELPIRFWEKNPWRRFFHVQLKEANRLLKEFPPSAVSRALSSREGRRIFSLRCPGFEEMVRRQKVNEPLADSAPVVQPDITNTPSFRPTFTRRVSILTGICNGEACGKKEGRGSNFDG